jgi:polyisoprenoid-binding protein YceI
MFKTVVVGALTLFLAACGALKPHNAAQPNLNEPPLPVDQRSPGKLYRIDESRSELRILVYRAGPLARLGHNHVMVNRSLRGAVNLADAPGESVFRLTVPVAGFVVDDAQARHDEGSDFESEVPEEAKAGTLQNMRSTAVLDADEFPLITVNSVGFSTPPGASGADSMIATVTISVAGHDSKIDVPFTVQRDSNQVSAAGSLVIRQSALGLTPYSLMLGALQVQDALTIKFKIIVVPD